MKRLMANRQRLLAKVASFSEEIAFMKIDIYTMQSRRLRLLTPARESRERKAKRGIRS